VLLLVKISILKSVYLQLGFILQDQRDFEINTVVTHVPARTKIIVKPPVQKLHLLRRSSTWKYHSATWRLSA